jgi:CspA family cold shock protein
MGRRRDRVEGTVSYGDERGFGWITPDDGSGDYFVRFNEIRMEGHKTLSVGQRVSFLPHLDPEAAQRQANEVELVPGGPTSMPLLGRSGVHALASGAVG